MINQMIQMLEITDLNEVQDAEIAILLGMYKLPRTFEDGKKQPTYKKIHNRLLIREKALLN